MAVSESVAAGRRSSWLAALAIALALLLTRRSFDQPSPAQAAGPVDVASRCHETQRGANVLALECAPGFSTASDRVTMYSRAPLDATKAWPGLLDYRDAVWLFDAGATGNPQLVINFYPRADGALVADVYDQRANILPVFKLKDGFPALAGGVHPVVQVRAADGWWTQAGKVNFNLDLDVDGKVMGAFVAERFLYSQTTDGDLEFQVKVRDTNRNGRPDYEIIQSVPDLPESAGYMRTEVLDNPKDNAASLQDYWFWPYLGFFTPFDKPDADKDRKAGLVASAQSWPCSVVQGYGASLPPIAVNAQTGTVDCILEFVASRGSANDWFSYSINRLTNDAAPGYADWESPFAFYDLANRNDGWPDLQVRVVNWPAGDRYSDCPSCIADAPLQEVRYSWDQTHDHAWSYKLDLIGRNQIDSVVKLPDLSLQLLPYDDVPGWVGRSPWQAAAFVAVEQPGYWTSEGVYEWDASPDVFYRYVTGQSGADVSGAYAQIGPGFRGEYDLDLGGSPQLYFSPLDGKLHLLHAQGGVWNLGNGFEMAYDNLDGGPYVDRWTYRDGAGKELASLVQVNQFVLYDGGGRVELVGNGAPPEVFFGSPPVNGATWQTLGNLLATYAATVPATLPGDLAALAERLRGPRVDLAGSVRDLRIRGDELRFVLELTSPVAAGDLAPVGVTAALPVGTYYAAVRDGIVRVSPLTPPSLHLALDSGQGDDAPRPFQPVATTVRLENSGLATASGVQVQTTAVTADGKHRVTTTQSVDVFGGDTATLTSKLAPNAPGAWHVVVQATLNGQSVSAEGDVVVTPAPVSDVAGLATGKALASSRLLPLVLIATALLAGLAGWLIWSRAR